MKQIILRGVGWGLAVGLMVVAPAGRLGAQTAPASPPRSAGPASPALVEDLVAAYRALAQQGIVDGYGHVSARHERDPNRFFMSRSLAPELVTADDLIEFDLDANPVDARGRALYSERYIHAEIFKVRPDVKVIVHHHSPSVVPFSVSSVPLRPIYHMSAFLWEGVPIFDLRDVDGMTDMLVNNARRGRALAQTLGSKPALLMRGHGAVVVGPSFNLAIGRSIYLEINARLQAQAMALGGPIKFLEPEEGRLAILDEYRRGWEMWKRKAMGR